MTSEFIARDAVLAVCPDARCRRAGRCMADGTARACRRSHEPADKVRDQISAGLEKMTAALKPRNGPPLSQYELELRLAEVKRGLEQREREWFARQHQKAQRAASAGAGASRRRPCPGNT